MPDQVFNLDAKSSGFAWAFKAALPEFVGPVHARNYTHNMDKLMKVEEGLHCLTGRDSKSETAYRRDIIKYMISDLQRSTPDCWVKFGLALHALGDSFAHRQSDADSSTMYAAPYGHALPGHSTDNINTHRPLYKLYGHALFAALLDVGKDLSLTPVLDRLEFDSALSTFSWSPDEDVQIDRIRGWSSTFGRSEMRLLNAYAPETAEPDPIPWHDFFIKYHAQYRFDSALLDRLQILITLWSR